jgi:hypothetical protein
MSTRIYLVGLTPGAEGAESARLVEAATPSQAIRHVATRYKAEVATTRQVADLVKTGVEVEVAGE